MTHLQSFGATRLVNSVCCVFQYLITMLQEGQALYDIVNREKIPITKDNINPPDNWTWVSNSNWELDKARACDDDGQ